MDQEIVRRLDEHDWNGSILKLTAYVITLCRLAGGQGIPSGLEPEDIVMEAIEKVYTGVRKWDPEKDPDLHLYLKSVVKSILSNKVNFAGNRILAGILLEDTLEDQTADAETELYARQLDQSISAAMRGDPELCLVYKALKDGLRPAQIAKEYAIEINTVRNAQKRLGRLVYKIIYPKSVA
jgi:DNA-directed RNA polymerase specialized sigma24 family protein